MEDENRRLKHLVADVSLNQEVLKAVIRKQWVKLAGLRRDVAFASAEFGQALGYAEEEIAGALPTSTQPPPRRDNLSAKSKPENLSYEWLKVWRHVIGGSNLRLFVVRKIAVIRLFLLTLSLIQ